MWVRFLLLAIFSVWNTLLQAEDQYQETLYPGWSQTFAITRMIHQEKTDFWDIAIFENPIFGRVLAIDGTIQTTEKDEAIYHEMLVHPALLYHDSPASILIIGGGDGGVLREVLRHDTVKTAVLVEIDRRVIDLTKEHMPSLSNGAFDDPRTQIVIQNASQYVKETSQKFDVILCDSCDPIGAGEALFTKEFYGHCKARLNEKGIFINQAGVPFMQKDSIESIFKNRKGHFKVATYYVMPVPTYIGGFMAIGWASDVKYRLSQETLKNRLARVKGKMRYYTPGINRAAFQLPRYMMPDTHSNK